jgi:pyruvate/2-oxoglutarate/acetoin dehydrogenase E1 component
MPRELPYIAAIEEAIRQEMDRDETVLLFGQNIATTENDPFLKAFGHDRVRVTPISETAEIGMAVGAALAGYGFTAGWAGQHTGSIYGMFMGVPGLKIALPATAADAKGLMATAIRDDNPVVFFHHYLLTLTPGEVPEGEHLVPFGSADIRRPGGDVTIVATGWMVHRALAAAERLAGEGVSAEVIDPRTLAPLDTATVIESVSKTGHLVLVDQATRHASASAVIAAEVADAGFGYLKAPVKQVTGLDTPIPYSKPMEEHVLPNEDKIVEAVRQVLSTTLVT